VARLAVSTLASIDARTIGGVIAGRPRVASGASEAALVVAPIVREAVVLGAFQRSTVAEGRRCTGGVTWRPREGDLFVALDLARPEALGGVVDPNRALNRHVRPALRALTTLSSTSPAIYGGRDFLSIAGARIAEVAVTHERSSGATAIEMLVSLDAARATTALIDAYSSAAGGDVVRFDATPADPPAALLDQPPFAAVVAEAIGDVGAAIGASRVAIGGDFMASTDAVAALGDRLHALGPDAPDDALGAAIDEALGPRSGALFFGVRSLRSVAAAVREAWRVSSGKPREAP
jgi:hypothetical protein